MQLLENPRHELFAQALACGRSAEAAATAAGYTPDEYDPTELGADERIRGRVRDILSDAARRAGVEAQRVICELARVAFASVSDVVGVEAGGVHLRADEDQIPADAWAAIKHLERSGSGGFYVEMHDKVAALVALGHYLGMFPGNATIEVDEVVIRGRSGEQDQ
jgi:phage terminase small subunit